MQRFLASCVLLVACGGSGAFPSPSPTPPLAPAENDASFKLDGLREWAIIGNDVDAGNETLTLAIAAPAGTDFVDAWLNGEEGFRFEKRDGQFVAEVDLSALGPGEYEILFAANGNDTAFAKHSFKRSHPYYVVVTTDWDTSDTGDDALALQEDLHAEHAELVLTHFLGPYTFTDPAISDEREALLVNWLKGMRDNHNDEIGLHIHPYCNFVEQAGTILGIADIDCITSESIVYSSDASGYTVRVSAYSEEDFTSLLLAADTLFEAAGLGKPTSFRAGAWTAELNTMRSLEAAGYVADTSALNWARLDEWNHPGMGTLYSWNKEHWASIGDSSQPYYPSKDDILATGDDTVSVLEVPSNGIMVDYVETSEMIDIFETNWDGSLLTTPVNLSIGFHPTNFNAAYKKRMTDTLSHADQFLASQDKGPVIYGRLSDMAKVWKRAP